MMIAIRDDTLPESSEALRAALECRYAQMRAGKELAALVRRFGGSLESPRMKLFHVRNWWALAAYRLVTERQPFPTPEELQRFVAKLAGVTEADARKVLGGVADFAPERLERLEEGLGVYGLFHPATVMGESYEEGIREYDEAREQEEQMREASRGRTL